MKTTRYVRACVAVLTCSSMLAAQLAQAAGPSNTQALPNTAAAKPTIRDVALQDSGLLRGQILDAQGVAQGAIPIVVVRQGQEIARTQSDESGRFAVSGVSGGVYEIHTTVGSAVYRAWAPRTAPPSAAQAAVIIPDNEIIRAQGGHALGWLANPWVLAGIVAAAIAIPLALDDDDAS